MSETRLAALGALAIRLETIERTCARWVQFDVEARTKEGMDSPDDTHLIAPTSRPTHRMLRNWVIVLQQARQLVGDLSRPVSIDFCRGPAGAFMAIDNLVVAGDCTGGGRTIMSFEVERAQLLRALEGVQS